MDRITYLRDSIVNPNTPPEVRMEACKALEAESGTMVDLILIDQFIDLCWAERGRDTPVTIRYDDIITLMKIDRGLILIQRAKFAVALLLWSGLCIGVGAYLL